MNILPFLSIVLLATFAQYANAQTSIPSPFWEKKVEPKEEMQESDKPEMQIFTMPIFCTDKKNFKKLVDIEGYTFSKFTAKTELVNEDSIYVLFYHNENTNEFAIVRTDGNFYCVIEKGKQVLEGTVGPV